MFLVSFLSILLIHNVISVPIIIKSGIVKNHGQHQNGNVYDAVANTGVTSYGNQQGFEKLDQGKFVKAQDEGSYLQKDADKKLKQNQGHYANENFLQNGEGLIQDSEKQDGHKKGHHKSGFHNTYHKDESGSNSSYFDDANDAGANYQYNGKRGNAGNVGSQKNQGSYSDGSHHEKDDTREGSYKNAGHLNANLGDQRRYNDERYLNDRKEQAETVAANQAGGRGNEIIQKHQPYYPRQQYYNEPQYIEEPYYPDRRYYEKPTPYVPEKKIIIYEDPRVYDNNLRYNNYETPYDRVRLDVRPAPNRYYEERPVYEDYYYD